MSSDIGFRKVQLAHAEGDVINIARRLTKAEPGSVKARTLAQQLVKAKEARSKARNNLEEIKNSPV